MDEIEKLQEIENHKDSKYGLEESYEVNNFLITFIDQYKLSTKYKLIFYHYKINCLKSKAEIDLKKIKPLIR